MLIVGASAASADQVDTLIERMVASSHYKQRLSAALNLQKTGDIRAIPAYIEALGDRHKTVRGVAAAALGKLIDSGVAPSLRRRAIVALRRTAAKDANAFVRKQARHAYEILNGLAARRASRNVYIQVGPMAAQAAKRSAVRMSRMMQQVVVDTLTKRAPHMATGRRGGKPRSKQQLARTGTIGFYLDGSVQRINVRKRGGAAIVSCKVSMVLASYPKKSMFGFLKGSAQVQASDTNKDIGFAKRDCVSAVVEDLVRRKIVPTISARAR